MVLSEAVWVFVRLMMSLGCARTRVVSSDLSSRVDERRWLKSVTSVVFKTSQCPPPPLNFRDGESKLSVQLSVAHGGVTSNRRCEERESLHRMTLVVVIYGTLSSVRRGQNSRIIAAITLFVHCMC